MIAQATGLTREDIEKLYVVFLWIGVTALPRGVELVNEPCGAEMNKGVLRDFDDLVSRPRFEV